MISSSLALLALAAAASESVTASLPMLT